MNESHQHPRQDCAPALAFGTRETRHQRRVICGDERLDEIEYRVPQPRFDGRAFLIVRDVLLRELGNDRLEPRVDLEQRFNLRLG